MRNEHRFGVGSKLLLSNVLNMLNKNLTGFVQSLFSVQSICTVRKGSASRVSKSIVHSKVPVGNLAFASFKTKSNKY